MSHVEYLQINGVCLTLSEEEPIGDTAPDHSALPSGVKLCWVCGCPGNKACSRCHAVTYCGKHHQTLHWKHTHKKECSSSGVCAGVALTDTFFPYVYVCMHVCILEFVLSSVCVDATTVKTSPFLFPEFELVTEPEEEEEEEDETEQDAAKAAKEGSVQPSSIGVCKQQHSPDIFLNLNVISLS